MSHTEGFPINGADTPLIRRGNLTFPFPKWGLHTILPSKVQVRSGLGVGEEVGNFAVEKPDNHYFSAVTLVNVNCQKSVSTNLPTLGASEK